MIDLLAGRSRPARRGGVYVRGIERSTGIFYKLIGQYYDHAFRELFLNGTGPLKVHRATPLPAGRARLPRPPWAVRWRLRLFGLFLRLQRKVALVPRRRHFSLRSAPAVEAAAEQMP